MEKDPGLLQPTSLLGYLLIFAGGLLTSIGPYNVAMVPLIIGYVGGSHDLSRQKSFNIALSITIGLAVTFVILGVIASLVGGLLGGSTRIWYYLVALVCLALGLQMLEILHLTLPSWFGGLREKVQVKACQAPSCSALFQGSLHPNVLPPYWRPF